MSLLEAARPLGLRVVSTTANDAAAEDTGMIERLSRWYCMRFHKGVIWKADGYECPVCFRLYHLPWEVNHYGCHPKQETCGIDRFFAQEEAR